MIHTIEIGAHVKRRHITEEQKVVLVGQNVVLVNEIGFYHTVSRGSFLADYVVMN